MSKTKDSVRYATCPKCDGTARVDRSYKFDFGGGTKTITKPAQACPRCHGTGRIDLLWTAFKRIVIMFVSVVSSITGVLLVIHLIPEHDVDIALIFLAVILIVGGFPCALISVLEYGLNPFRLLKDILGQSLAEHFRKDDKPPDAVVIQMDKLLQDLDQNMTYGGSIIDGSLIEDVDDEPAFLSHLK